MHLFIHLLLHLLQNIFKLLAWLDEKLPDSKVLGWKLVLAGLFALIPLLADDYFVKWGAKGEDFVIIASAVGAVCLILGGYILFRRAVWDSQDRRSSRITSLRLK